MHPDNVLERRAKALAADLRVLAAPDFLKLDLPPREPVLGPVLVRGSVTLLRGRAGLGKSWLALSLAHAAASGVPVLGWSAPRAARVLHVDAQMPLTLLQARLAAIAGFGGAGEGVARDPLLRPSTPNPHPELVEGCGFGAQDEEAQDEGRGEGARSRRRRKSALRAEDAASKLAPNEGRATAPPGAAANLHLLAAEAQAFALPDLGMETGRAALRRLLFAEPDGPDGAAAPVPRVDLLVLDGLSALLRSARGRNDPAREFAEFLSQLRRGGLCVLLVDRARTRKRLAPPFEDMLDAVIDVRRPAGLGDTGAPHMAVALSGRGLASVEAFEARLVLPPAEADATTEEADEAPGWRRVARLDAAVLEAWRLERQGASYRAIARELGVSVATAWRLAQKAAALDPAVLEAAAAECDGELAEEGETGGTDETGETPETAGAAAGEEVPTWRRKLARVERALWMEMNGGASPQAAAKLWARVIAAAKLPPGVLFRGPEWGAVDRALHAHIGAGLEAAGEDALSGLYGAGDGAAAARPRPPPASPSHGSAGSSASLAPSPTSASRGAGPPGH